MGYKLQPETFKRALSVQPSVDFVRSVMMRMKMMMETERGKGQSAQSTTKSDRFEKMTLYFISNSSTVNVGWNIRQNLETRRWHTSTVHQLPEKWID